MPFTIVKANITTICQNNHNWRPTPIIGTDNFTYFPGVEILLKGTDSITFLAETVPFYKISTPGNWVNLRYFTWCDWTVSRCNWQIRKRSVRMKFCSRFKRLIKPKLWGSLWSGKILTLVFQMCPQFALASKMLISAFSNLKTTLTSVEYTLEASWH